MSMVSTCTTKQLQSPWHHTCIYTAGKQVQYGVTIYKVEYCDSKDLKKLTGCTSIKAFSASSMLQRLLCFLPVGKMHGNVCRAIELFCASM